jgi:hypothetical protein
MRFKLILAALLVSSAPLFATERATFILTDGARINGAVVARTVTGANVSRGNFALSVGNREMEIPMSEVAVIDFAGGKPSTAELNGLVGMPQQVIVFRNGRSGVGRLVNLVGDSVRWRYEPGGTEDIPMREVRRIYLDPGAGRDVFEAAIDRWPADSGVGRAEYANVLSPPAGFQVPARWEWADTGITVRKGDLLTFAASGEIAFGHKSTQIASPDGTPVPKRDSYPVPAMPVGGLIGKVGRSDPFPIGSNTNAIRMPADGRLLLGVNDNHRGDNSGTFFVVVRSAAGY